jgi:hypothetical protein
MDLNRHGKRARRWPIVWLYINLKLAAGRVPKIDGCFVACIPSLNAPAPFTRQDADFESMV